MKPYPDTEWISELSYDSASYLTGVHLDRPERSTDVRDPIALFLAGGPLSGKTTTLERLLADGHDLAPRNAVRIEPTLIRHRLPEFTAAVAVREREAAGLIFQETCHIARELVEHAAEAGADLIIDGIGDAEEGLFASRLEAFHDAGYDVRVLLVDAPTSVAQERNLERARRTGFYLEPRLIIDLHRDVLRRFEDWRHFEWLRFEMYSTGSSESDA